MANKDNEVEKPIIIKKVKKGGHGHHGGAWKVAYADFVTAMMAFFLLMWLLAVSSKEQKNAISNYFDPTHPRVSSELSGAGGVLGGMTISPEGAQVSNVQDVATPTTPMSPRPQTGDGGSNDGQDDTDYETDPLKTDKATSTDEDGNDLLNGINVFEDMDALESAEIDQLQAVVDELQNESFESIKEQIYEEIEKAPELASLKENLMIDITPEGLRIQIIDDEGRSMFPSGSANMFPFMTALVEKVTQILIPQPNQISVRGHTDGTQYPAGATYNNWNLSADRALASQKAMLASDLPVNRVQNVVGKADREHLFPEEPLSPRNRRISVILLREKLENADEIRKAAAEAIEKKRQQIEAESEDRENVPALDQVVEDAMTSFTIAPNAEGDDAEIIIEEEQTNDPVADEIRKLQQQNQAPQRQAPALSAPTRTPSIKDGDVLEF